MMLFVLAVAFLETPLLHALATAPSLSKCIQNIPYLVSCHISSSGRSIYSEGLSRRKLSLFVHSEIYLAPSIVDSILSYELILQDTARS